MIPYAHKELNGLKIKYHKEVLMLKVLRDSCSDYFHQNV